MVIKEHFMSGSMVRRASTTLLAIISVSSPPLIARALLSCVGFAP